MSKYNLVGIVIAALILVFALAAKAVGGRTAVGILLPVLAVMTGALCAVDIAAYRKDKRDGGAFAAGSIIRIISLAVLSLLLCGAAVYSYLI